MSERNNKENNCKECEICKVEAKYLCFECNSYFCEDCHKFIHDKHVNSSHKKISVDLFVNIDLKCNKHPKDRINLFCLNEKGK